MDAIDWPALARGALWVFGLSVSLASVSHVRWAAKREGVPLRKALSWDSFVAAFCAGLALFAVSMAWGATRLWETLAWLVLALLFSLQVGLAVRAMRVAAPQSDGERQDGGEHDAAEIVEEER